MHIRIYHKSLWPKYKGAIFSALYQLTQARNLRVSFVHVAETDEIRLQLGGVDLTYHRYPFRVIVPGSYEDAGTLRRTLALAGDLIRNPADLVVLPGYDRIENWMMLFICMLMRRKRAVFCDSTINDNPQVWWKVLAKRLFFSRCDAFVGYGQRTKEYLVSLGASPDKVIVPCVAPALPHEYNQLEVRATYATANVEPSPARFLYLGRLAPEKGLMDLLDAFTQVRDTLPGARLDIIGAGILKEPLLKRIAELGLGESVALLGTLPLTAIVPYFYQSAALVLPSHSEPWGLVANEALSYGCPVVIADRCGCVPELVIEGVSGYSFRVGDIEDLRAAMVKAVALSQNRRTTAESCVAVASKLMPGTAAEQMLNGLCRVAAPQAG
jgi:glycosyltransferase involved in cell wall biosynthesis